MHDDFVNEFVIHFVTFGKRPITVPFVHNLESQE
jgi:hypothetical protein